MKVDFEVLLTNFGTTAVTNAQSASQGSGTYEQVAELEYFARGFDGWTANRNAVPAQPQPAQDATSGAQYDVITISTSDTTGPHSISGVISSPYDIYIAMVDGAAQTTTLLSQLDPWMASTPGAFAPLSI